MHSLLVCDLPRVRRMGPSARDGRTWHRRAIRDTQHHLHSSSIRQGVLVRSWRPLIFELPVTLFERRHFYRSELLPSV
jgi:hypothetical protein